MRNLTARGDRGPGHGRGKIGGFSETRYEFDRSSIQARLHSGVLLNEGDLVSRALRSHNLWLTVTYIGLLVLMARAYA
jgi:hypothetical protein